MVRAYVYLVAVLLVGCASQQSTTSRPRAANVSSEVVTTRDLVDVVSILSEAYQGRTLLVLDIDDTLLTSPTFFGSGAWYEWQASLSPQAPGYVPCKSDVIAMSYEAGTQVPTQDDAVAAVNVIPIDKIIVTGRSPMSRGGTIRELKKAGYKLPAPLQPEFAGAIYEYRQGPDAPGVTVSYHEGVLMTSGQNKGLVLLHLLKLLQLSYDRVVLVDDGEQNITAMSEAMKSTSIDYRGVHYTRIDKNVDAQREQEGIAGWKSWQQLLSTTYPERLARMKAGECAY